MLALCLARARGRILFTANEIHFICWGKCCQVPMTKKEAIQIKNPRMPSWQKPVLTHKAPEKGDSVTCSKKLNQGERIFFSQPSHPVGQKMLSSALKKT